MTLEGRTVLVTGSSRGIGRAIALELARRGANVAINYVTQEDAAIEVVRRIEAMGRRAFAVRADVSKPEDLDALFSEVSARWGSLDVFVNNAIDVAAYGPLARLTHQAWTHTVSSHATTFLVSARNAAALMPHGGVILGLSSLGSRMCFRHYAAIGVGKAAIEALTRYLAVEFGPLGIRVNTLSAGPIDTESLRSLPHFDSLVEFSSTQLPSRRMGTPADVAGVAAFLCSDETRWICGQTIVADGGLSLLAPQLVSSAAAVPEIA